MKRPTRIPCKRCHGTGKLTIAPTLDAVFRAIPMRGGVTLTELQQRVASRSPASLAMKLAKLEAHGLVWRILTDDGYAWGRR